MAAGNGSIGTATVTGDDSTWSSGGDLHVGQGMMATGTLLIEDGALVSNTDGFVGEDTGSEGTVVVSGTDSTWTNDGRLIVGRAGMGTLGVMNAGHLNVTGQLDVGVVDVGVMTVDGASATVGGFFHIGGTNSAGADGHGTLNIVNGGNVTSSSFCDIGRSVDSTGIAHVSGVGTSWNTGALTVGELGDGTLEISDGAHVNSTVYYSDIGRVAGSTGAVTVQGAESSWTQSAELVVGWEGTGTLLITDGAHVSTAAAGYVAISAGSTGTATVSGTSSNWTVGERLSIGGDADTDVNGGTGTLRIQSGAAVAIADEIELFPDGLVDLEGGALAATTVNFHGGGAFDWTGGTLHVANFNGNLVNQGGALAPGQSAGSTAIVGNYMQQAGGTLQIEIGGTLANAEHDFVNVTGNAFLGGELELALINGFVPNPMDSFTVFSADNLLNFFSNVTNSQRLTTTDGTGSFLVHYGPTSTFDPDQIVLTSFQFINIPGDFNLDGTVSAVDYVVWRNGLGTSYTPAQYEVWRTHFGQSVASGAALLSARPPATGVPEPAGLVLILVGMLATFYRRRSAV